MRGRMVLGLCNLPPRAMRGVLSAGMLLCASNDDHTRSANVTSYFAPRGFFAVTFDEGYGGGVALRPVFFQGLKNQPRDWPQPRLFPVYEKLWRFSVSSHARPWKLFDALLQHASVFTFSCE